MVAKGYFSPSRDEKDLPLARRVVVVVVVVSLLGRDENLCSHSPVRLEM